MTIHRSLAKSSASSGHRSVMKRYEKVQNLKSKGLWSDDSSVMKIPKIKSMKIKVKKEKPKEAAAGATTETAVAATEEKQKA